MSDSEPDKTSQPILGPDSKQAAALEAVHTLAMNLQVRVLCVCVLCVYLCVCTYMCN
jgi:hypothetical protein